MPKSTEAFSSYHRQKELLTEYIQISTAALALLCRNVEVPNAPEMLGTLVDACGIKHWGNGKKYNRAIEKVNAGRDALACQGIIQQVSAFDYFTRNIIVELARLSSRARHEHPQLAHEHHLLKLSPQQRWVISPCCNEVVDHLHDFSERLDELRQWIGWQPSARLIPILPLIDLVRQIRNRIAHYDSFVGSELEEFARSRNVTEALSAFRQRYARRSLPELPSFDRGVRLQLTPVHVILFGAFFYEIAKEVNAHAADLLSDDEFIDMAFFYSCIVSKHSFRTIRHRSADTRIRHYLTGHYLRENNVPSLQRVIRRLSNQSLAQPTQRPNQTTLWRIAQTRHQEMTVQQ